jgi:cytoskeletal protein CcmA (bactofilin family)
MGQGKADMADSSVFCSKCGAETFATAHFCTVCGSQLTPMPRAAEASGPRAAGAKVPELNLADIDQHFDALIDQTIGVTASPAAPLDPQTSFRQLAQEQLRPIREFMIELDVGDIWPERIPACRTAIQSLEDAARKLGLEPELMPAIRELSGAFQRLSAQPEGDRATGEHLVLKRAYQALIERLRVPSIQPARTEDSALEWVDEDEEEGKREHTMDNDMPKEKRTIVEEGSHFKGTLSSSCPVDVRGRVDGEIETPSLTVSTSGAVHGRAKVGAVRSDGELAGEFDADTVELAGVVRDNTVIRARAMDVKLSSQRGKLQVIFGECELPASEAQSEERREAPMPELDGQNVAVSGDSALAAEIARIDGKDDAEQRAELAPAAGGDENGNWKRRRSRGNRHSDPPPAVG